MSYGHGNHWVSKDDDDKTHTGGKSDDSMYDPEDPYTTRPKTEENDGFGRKNKRKGWFGIF